MNKVKPAARFNSAVSYEHSLHVCSSYTSSGYDTLSVESGNPCAAFHLLCLKSRFSAILSDGLRKVKEIASVRLCARENIVYKNHKPSAGFQTIEKETI